MAFTKDQKEPKLPIGQDSTRSASDFLPRYFRTNTNRKILNGTLDQLISVGNVDKINAYIGRKSTKAYTPTDNYLEEISLDRQSYQLEPAILVKDKLDNVTFFKDYNDYINQLLYFNTFDIDHELTNSQEFYSWNPHIDWDKFVNYREYYWLPMGPQSIAVKGQSKDIVSTYSISLVEDSDNFAYIFTPDGLTRNPTLKLYRGQTYNFDIDCEGQPLTFSTNRSQDITFVYKDGVTKDSEYVEKGTITFKVPDNAPDIIYYVSKNNINTSGFFKIYDIEENTAIDVEKEILGKKTYLIDGITPLSSGMKINFIGNVTPEKYSTGFWYVEGVGNAIRLVDSVTLENPGGYTFSEDIDFDSEKFDTQGFDSNNNYPSNKDYITINRSSRDRNPWSRYNRWFHKSVIETSAAYNNQPIDLDQEARAKRPIVEFDRDIQLWNFGVEAKNSIDLIDLYTKDVFSTVEGSFGFKVDGVSLVEGMRVLFAADTDKTVNGRIFKVTFVTHLGQKRISLIDVDDTNPIEGESVLVLQGDFLKGKTFHYSSGVWNLSQEKTGLNQPPLFDTVDVSGNSFGDRSVYIGSTFQGTKIFSYAVGDVLDPVLGFNIDYRNIGNIGDIVFDFNLQKDQFTYQGEVELITKKLDRGYLKKNISISTFNLINGWVKAEFNSKQPVIRQYDTTTQNNLFEIDVYKNSATLDDLEVSVFVDDIKQPSTSYEVYRQNSIAYIQFNSDLDTNRSVVLETRSAAKKLKDVGYYKFPSNLESNPQNLSLDDLTLGEITNHLKTIVDNSPSFSGQMPGISNLRDIGDQTGYGSQIIQHSAPLAPIIYSFTNKNVNIIKSLRYANDEYSKFKRNFIRTATTLGYDGETRDHVDLIFKELRKNSTTSSPFYLSDMVPFGVNFIYEQEIIDDSFTDYPLTFDFNLETLSRKSVLVYLNDTLLLYGRDYIFTNDSFVRLLAPITTGDNLKVAQYENSLGCCVPPTPTKLGLYPKFEPKIFIDNTYQTPTLVIQGHDGSITVAFNDYRDNLILELEYRIYNNIKKEYDPSLFDINNFIEGHHRKTNLSTNELNLALRQEFLTWLGLTNKDYTKHDFFDRNNPYTFNYKSYSSSDGTPLIGFWRGIYKYFYDTDRPHTHPWEMLGFSNKPTWWDSVYGIAPYTKDNLILWNDLRDGIIREPGILPKQNKKYVREDLLTYIPVDAEGNLLNPLEIGLVRNYVATSAEKEFTFGDWAPVETAWRRGSQYPFALITALTLLRPAQMFAVCFDRERQYRDGTGQIVYKMPAGNLRFNTTNLVFPNTVKESENRFTSGLINYMCDYAISKSFGFLEEFKTELSSLQIKISSKLAGFTSKEKFKLILDSRSPLNQGNVFIPQENYNIILNTSSPILSISYSGVIIEKTSSGFVINGYNKSNPDFRYFKPLDTVSDPTVNVGGISETYLEWTSGKTYTKGQVVRVDQNFYRVTASHDGGPSFELKYFAKLPALPIVGGREVIIRRNFTTEVSTIHYGAELKTTQEVVDFVLGYGKWLESQGFIFDSFNPVIKTVTDWQTSAKEFAFWTTQNWSTGSVITLSPAAEEVTFGKLYAVADSIYDPFYEYTVFKQDGQTLDPNFTNTVRENNSFSIRPKDTGDGVYHITLNLIQKEHVLILDDVTVFNDVIYDQTQGYRQDRIKVVGYKISDWNGDFVIPGFVYDRAVLTEWKPWRDYALGETVKYKEFYYSARKNIPGTELFNDDEWYRLNGKPESKLIPNWDYRATQFEDFYDLDTDSFDVDQQKFAQHLIGYQKRQYLENIINDDVSQYKFYQGMIQEKGTKNSLSKLFDVLSSTDADSLEFYEEWAIRLGQYGASEGFEEVEYLLDESQFLINPQPIELVDSVPPGVNDFVYRITRDKVYLKPDTYDHKPIPTVRSKKEYIPTAGYVHLEDIKYIITSKDQIGDYNINDLKEGDYFWLGFDKTSWNVYRFTLVVSSVRSFQELSNLRINFNSASSLFSVNDFIGINNTNSSVEGIKQVLAVGPGYIEIELPQDLDTEAIAALNNNLQVNLFAFTSQRLATTSSKISTIDDLNDLPVPRKKNGELVWIDGANNDWSVWKFDKSYSRSVISNTADYFGRTLAVSEDDSIFAVSSLTTLVDSNGDPRVDDNGDILKSDVLSFYTRSTEKFSWLLKGEISKLTTIIQNESFQNTNYSFGESLALSAAGDYLLVGAPAYGIVEIPQPPLPPIEIVKNWGYVAKYNKNRFNNFEFDRVILSPVQTDNEFFGHKIAISGNVAFIAGKGSDTAPASLTAYNLASNTTTVRITFSNVEIIDLTTGSDNTVVISKSDSTVAVYKLVGNSLTLIQNISSSVVPGTLIDDKFGQSVSISKDNSMIAVGIPYYSEVNSNQGTVAILIKSGSTYQYSYRVNSPLKQESERFGYRVRFNPTGNRLVVYSYGGDQTIDTTIDQGTTTFDLDAMKFVERSENVGSVRVYEKYGNKFIFDDELEPQEVIGINYGDNLVVGRNNIYVNDYTAVEGRFYEFVGRSTSWTKYRSPDPIVDLTKIKSIFLYDTVKNNIIQNLDFIDPINGKVLGVAEQELSFKTYYDPAVYSTGTDAVVVDSLMPWKQQQVGKLWWDLSTIKFVNPNQGSVVYKANTWNNVFAEAEVDIYEWVESEYSPEEWDSLADTEAGLTLGISGVSKYGAQVYSVSQTYDNVSKTFKNIYYFWVKNKSIVPDVTFRKVSAREVSELISNPKSKGIRYVTLLGNNQLALVNCKELITDKDVALNIRYWIIDKTDQNIHSHYQLLAEGNVDKKLNKYVEQKWFDSLIGYDNQGREIPDPSLPPKLKYGILSKPRQSMFVNRLEALKQVIERVNSVLVNNLLIDDFDFDILNSKEEPPSEFSREYDIAIDTQSQIRFVGSTGFDQATASLVIKEGKIERVIVTSAGRGYKIPPSVKVISNTGSGARLSTVINSSGEVTAINIDNAGRNYQTSTFVEIRPFTVLVTTDETAASKWSLYTWNSAIANWTRSRTQIYDVTKHWNYIDWYATGFSSYTKINHQIDLAYEMSFIDIAIGDIVKINNEKTGGWILLQKINNLDTDNVSLNYKTVGRQNGTIQFNSNLYKFKNSNIGYDSTSYDRDVYDDEPKEELRFILSCIKNNLLIDNLEIEYNKLFFSSLRYVFTEQGFVDWAFKTSFIKAKHNLGELKQKVTFKSDNLESYEDYINEVKPYRTKIREFISNYTAYDQTNSAVTDFDLPPRYVTAEGQILPFTVKVKNSQIEYIESDILKEPYQDWLSSVGYQVVEIRVIDGGTGYQGPPQVEIVGDAETTATAKAYVSQGAVSKVIVETPGQGYVTIPTIRFNGSVGATGRPAKAIVVLGNSLVRTNNLGIKFDRISPEFTVSSITVTQAFDGTGSRTRFELRWPVDLSVEKTTVFIDTEELLSNDFEVSNELDTTSKYTRYKGILTLTKAAPITTTVTINYAKDIRLLDAADRIQYYYEPGIGQLGKDLGQLMEGVDYGGVEVTGLDFDLGAGWDGLPWFTSGWDDFDVNYTDHLVVTDGVQRTFELPYTPADGEALNIYLNSVRIDDPNYDVYTLAEDNYNSLVAELVILQQEEEVLQQAYDQAVIDYDNIIAEQVARQEQYDNLTADYAPDSGAEPDPDRPWAVPGGTDPINIPLENLLTEILADIADLQAQAIAAATVRNNALDDLTDKQQEVADKEDEVSDALDTLNAAPEITNPTASMNTFYGDGITNEVVIPNNVVIADKDQFIFRKITSDGSFKPNEKFYDSEIIGGLPNSTTGGMSYETAKGILAEEIIIDGDNFVTTTSSHAPEEVVTGQVLDSVSITVYDTVSDGSPVILNRHYIADGVQTEFAIGQKPNTTQAALVKINGFVKKQDVDYTFDYINQKIIFDTAPQKLDEVVITSMSRNGLNVLDADSFVGDGITKEFITVARWEEDKYSVLVTINGEAETVTTFITDSSYSEVGNIGIIFDTAPVAGAIIDYTVLSSTVNTISYMKTETVIHDGTADSYVLTQIPSNLKPFENNVIVEVAGEVLRPSDAVYFDVQGTNRTYIVDVGDYALNSIDTSQVEVYRNGVKLSVSIQYTWTSTKNELKIKRGIANPGDKIVLVIVDQGQYYIEPDGTDLKLRLVGTYTAGDKISVTTFSNHDILEIERNNTYIRSASELIRGTPEYYTINEVINGRFKLRYPISSASYVWVTFNGKLLTSELDYILEDNNEYIQIDKNRNLLETDLVEIIVFNDEYTKRPFGYRIFKDMLNRTFYKRIDDTISTKLATPLNYFDTEIEVEDASGLLEPNRDQNEAGIIYINAERIEYLEKDGNTLRYLRRGTLGTGTPASHPIGSFVRDQGKNQTIPYKDETETVVLVADGYLSALTDFENSSTVTVTDIRYASPVNNNTAFPLGGQTVTVKGTGFKSNVKAYVGNTECPTTYISPTELTFVNPQKTVGAYDLVITNPSIIIDGNLIPSTSRVVPGAIKYLQILLPFSPAPNPSTETGWYKNTEILNVSKIQIGRYYTISESGTTDFIAMGAGSNNPGHSFLATATGTGTGTVINYSSIPYEYWEGQDIEMFIGGKRLRKSPLSIWDESLGPDSPSGDKTLEAEFAVNKNIGPYVRLTTPPPKGSKIIVQKKLGQMWTAPGVQLSDSQTDQAKFIRAGVVYLPGKTQINNGN
jgi:hypothetical protein